MSRLARNHRVFFFEEPIYDDPPSSVPWLETYEALPNLVVCTPHLPEGTDAAQTAWLTRQLLDGLIAEHGIHPRILWFYTPMALRFAGELSAPIVVYDCMDDLSSFLHAPAELAELEHELLKRADVVFTGGRALYEAKRGKHPRLYCFPSSVDATHFAKARERLEDPPDQRELPAPRLGYFGVVDERLDLALIEKIASARPDWTLVIIGPVAKIDSESLPRARNIHWLGGKSYAELPSYIAHWQVALMPFALNEATRFISPTKTLEYLAAGVPVVSTAVTDVVRPYGEAGVVHIADRANIIGVIERALEQSLETRARADEMVAATSWDRTWAEMNAVLLSCLRFEGAASEGQAHV